MFSPKHAVQGKLTGADTALARWLVFCHTHCDLPLDYRLVLLLPLLLSLFFFCHTLWLGLWFLPHILNMQSFPADPGEVELRPGQLSSACGRGSKVQRSRSRLRQSLCGVHPKAQVSSFSSFKLPLPSPPQAFCGIGPRVSCSAWAYSQVPQHSGDCLEKMQLTGVEKVLHLQLSGFSAANNLINRLSLDLGQFVISGWLQHQEGGRGGGGELRPGLVQLHPRQDADWVEPGDEDQEPDQPGKHPGPGPERRLQRLPRPVPVQPLCQLQTALLQARNFDVGGDGFVHFQMQCRSEMNIRGL